MATKQENLSNPASCLNKAGPNEPIFVLRANDPIASKVVRIWASLSEADKTQPREKCGAAWQVAVAMEAWREARAVQTEQGVVLPPSMPEEHAHGWLPHTAGDPAPCPDNTPVDIMTRFELENDAWTRVLVRAGAVIWGKGHVVAWKPVYS